MKEPKPFEHFMQMMQSHRTDIRKVDPVSQLASEPTERITETLEKLYRTDVTVHYLRQLAAVQGWTETEMLRRMVVSLAQDKQRYFDEAVRLAETQMVTTPSMRKL